MKNNGTFAIYNGIEYRCCFRSNGMVGLLSNEYIEGFTEFMGTYSKDVLIEDCSRIFKNTLCFKYFNDSFIIREETTDKVLLETGARDYNLIELGFKRIFNDTFQKWVALDEGEKYWSVYNYK